MTNAMRMDDIMNENEADFQGLSRNLKRIVVKIGSNILTRKEGLNLGLIENISRQISALIDKGLEVLLVSSGAMALGVKKLGLPARPDEIPLRQAVSAIGQAGLINEYEKAFDAYGKKVAQILLTSDDLSARHRYLNARNAMHALVSWGVVPIINENDTVSVEEVRFADNDNLSAMIALLMDGDVLINLTDIEGLYDKDPRVFPDAKLIREVSQITDEVREMATGIPGRLGTGGMASKITAAAKVTDAGIPMIITKGDIPDVLLKLYEGELSGTYFKPKDQKLANRKCWIAYTSKPEGFLRVDDGAEKALLKNGKSLLPIGILGVEGDFGIAAIVDVMNRNNQTIGRGLVNYSARDIRIIKGVKSDRIKEKLGFKLNDEVIHRDNLAIFTPR